jgi:hypothetical protein
MKTTSKVLTVAAVAMSMLTSAAYAGSDLQQQRLAEENAAYFQQRNGKGTSGMSAHRSEYDFAVTPQQRMAKRNAEYWTQKGSSAAQSQGHSGVSQYPCASCVYDAQQGGYVAKPHRR